MAKGSSRISRIQSSINRADACGYGGGAKKAGLVPSNEWNGVSSKHVERKALHRLPPFIRVCCASYR